MYSYDPDELNLTVEIWREMIHPDDKEAIMERLMAHLEGRSQQYICEHRLQCKDGGYK